MDNAGRVAGGDLAADLSNSRNSVRQNKLTFPILSDAKGEVAAAFGLRFRLPDYLVEVYQGLKNNLPLFNDDRSWTRPMPARYVIGQDTTILYASVSPDYTRRPEPEELIPALEQVAARKAACAGASLRTRASPAGLYVSSAMSS